MVNFFRLSKYFVAFLVILIISAAIAVGGLLRPIDLEVYKTFYLNSQIEKSNDLIKDKIIFVDIPVNDNAGNFLGVEILRGQVANLMDTIGSMDYSEKEPPTVILDMTFSSNPIALDSIKNAIHNLVNGKGIKVYASYELPLKGDPISFQAHDEFQAKVLYDSLLTGGRLNTKFNTHGNGILSYDSFELIGNKPIPSLAVQVINDYSKRGNIDLTDSINYPLPIRLPFDKTSLSDNFYEFMTVPLAPVTHKFSKQDRSINLSDKFVIVGLGDDIQDIDGNHIPGPYLVASAIIDQLNGNEFTRPSHDDIAVQLAMVLVFPFFVCLIFALIYKYVKILQTKPHFIAILAFIVGLLLLIGFGYAMLNYTIIRPALPMLSMAWAAVLAWHFTKKFLVTGIMEGGEIYDVFISYSRGDSNFVKNHLYQPLSEFKKPDGSKLNIFFDQKSIGIGELFTTKYMRAIVDSKLFVPVISEEYYKKNHCRNEMDLAVKRKIEKLINLCIIAVDYKYVPEEFTNINFVDISKQGDFISTLKKEIVKAEPQLTDTSEWTELDQEEPKPSEHKEQEKVNKKDKNSKKQKSKKEKSKKKKSKKELDKKAPKEKEKKEKKAKKEKKGSERKDQKKQEKKDRKRFEKQYKIEQKKKAEKRLEKEYQKEQKKKAKKHQEKKDKKRGKKKSKKS